MSSTDRVVDAVSDGGVESFREMLDELSDRGWTQVEIADRLGTHQPLVSLWKTGRVTPSRRYRASLALLYEEVVEEQIRRNEP